MEGYLLLHRKMLEWGWYDDINTKVLFLHCLLRANWKPCEWHGQKIEAGQFVTSLQSLSEETQLSVRQVRTALDHLVMSGELTNKSQSKYRIITVNNWGLYQVSDKQMTNKRQTNDKQTTTDEESNKGINIKNIFMPPSVDEVRAYCQERNNGIDPDTFVNFYSSKGWMIGKNKMKDWKSAVRTWERSRKDEEKKDKPKFGDYNQRSYDYDALLKDIM